MPHVLLARHRITQRSLALAAWLGANAARSSRNFVATRSSAALIIGRQPRRSARKPIAPRGPRVLTFAAGMTVP